MNTKTKVALVTGASGFIGKHLCRLLLQREWAVHTIVRPTTNISELLEFAGDRIVCHSYDGTNDRLINIIGDVQPTVVFHLASLFLASHQFKDIAPLISSNLIFSTQLVEAMVQNKVYSLVNTGTSWQHYQNDTYNPVNLYAATKQAFQDILRYYQETTPLNVITLKLFDTYGPGDPRPKLINLLHKAAATGETVKLSPGAQYLDLVYIDDAIAAFLLAADYLISHQFQYCGEYMISSAERVNLKQLVGIFENVLGKKLNIQWGALAYRPREVMNPWSTGKVLPGWISEIRLKEGLYNLL